MMTVSTQTHLRIHLAMILLQRIPLIPAMILHLTAVHLILVHLTPVRELILETLSLQLTVTVQPVRNSRKCNSKWNYAGGKDVLTAMAGVPFGTKLLINGNVYTVEDLWNSVWPCRYLLQQSQRSSELWITVCGCLPAELI